MKWINLKNGEGKLKCKCENEKFLVFITEDGDIYGKCTNCKNEKVFNWINEEEEGKNE